MSSEGAEMKAKEKVLAVWPDAHVRWGSGSYSWQYEIWSAHDPSARLLGSGATRYAAWQSAAESLPPVEAKEPKPTPSSISTELALGTCSASSVLHTEGTGCVSWKSDRSGSDLQTFEGWMDRHVKARDQSGFTYNDLRACYGTQRKARNEQPD